jgi:predicted ferric reductase
MLGATAAGWLAFADAKGDDGSVAFALFIGSVSILLMSWSNTLATRSGLLEPLFGGLDKMYRWHRWFGAMAVGAMWLHIQTVDDVKGIRGASKSVAEAAEELAGTGEVLLYVLIVASLVRWIPYRWWRQSHKLLILPYVFASWHFHTATKPYANSSLWGRWFQAIMLLGIATWAYRVLWRDGIRRGVAYRISGIDRTSSVTTLEMEPAKRKMKFRPGQFVFLRIGSRSVSEPHPFTIASGPSEPVLRIHVKNLGDWSGTLADRVSVGDTVRVEGPYGRLHLFPKRSHPVVWIAGGVGITPFLGTISEGGGTGHVPHLFYAVRSRNEAPGLDVLASAHAEGRIVLHLHVSDEGSRLRPDDLRDVFGPNGLRGAHVAMCGPDALINDMTRTVRSLGARHVHVEAFDIRTGIGPDLSREVDQLIGSIRSRMFDRESAVQDSPR